MKKLLLIMIAAVYFVSCNSHGDHYNVNDNSIIYYKDGMTQGDAKILGDFLVKNGYFDTRTEKAVQLGVEKDTINIKFGIDRSKVTDEMSVQSLFIVMGTAISAEVFGGKPLKIVLADQELKAFDDVTIPGTSMGEPAK